MEKSYHGTQIIAFISNVIVFTYTTYHIPAVAFMFDREKLKVHHFMCVGTTNNNSAIARKVVSKTAINCGCAF